MWKYEFILLQYSNRLLIFHKKFMKTTIISSSSSFKYNRQLHFNGILNKFNSSMQFNSAAVPISIFCRKGNWNREYMHGGFGCSKRTNQRKVGNPFELRKFNQRKTNRKLAILSIVSASWRHSARPFDNPPRRSHLTWTYTHSLRTTGHWLGIIFHGDYSRHFNFNPWWDSLICLMLRHKVVS